MPAIVRGGGGISRKSDGEIFEDSIPAGITCETISVLYNAMWVENVKVFNGETSNSIYKGEVLLSDKKSTVSQYSTSRQVRFTKKACSFKTDISIADIREFIVKLGAFVYDISFGKNYYGLTRKVYVQLFDKNENRVDFFDDGSSVSCHLLLDIQNGVIKEIAFGTGSSADHKDAKTKYAFSVKVNTVSRSIIDATAVPADVKKGKIFYNSEGRQVGTLDGLPIKYIGDITIIGGKEPVDYIKPSWSGLAKLYASANTDLARFETLFGGSSEAPSYSSGRDGFLKIPTEQINKVFLVYQNLNKIPIYLKEERISVALVVHTGNSWIQEIRFDFDYETKELSWVINQDNGQFGLNYQYRVYVY